ncbi:binding-protein-dependent transport systems inner membrane component [Alicyclobacillus hesperidum URH17-3-68]|nr:binding-protein-dependent transport systems inner membrane component [Alicyclobacillus hesperidum URH17-3-68]
MASHHFHVRILPGVALYDALLVAPWLAVRRHLTREDR